MRIDARRKSARWKRASWPDLCKWARARSGPTELKPGGNQRTTNSPCRALHSTSATNRKQKVEHVHPRLLRSSRSLPANQSGHELRIMISLVASASFYSTYGAHDSRLVLRRYWNVEWRKVAGWMEGVWKGEKIAGRLVLFVVGIWASGDNCSRQTPVIQADFGGTGENVALLVSRLAFCSLVVRTIFSDSWPISLFSRAFFRTDSSENFISRIIFEISVTSITQHEIYAKQPREASTPFSFPRCRVAIFQMTRSNYRFR